MKGNIKKILILGMPILFAVSLSVTLAACMTQADRELEDNIVAEKNDNNIANEVQPVTETVSALTFASNGDGTCYVSGTGNCRDETVVIPQMSPSGEVVTGIGESAFIGCETIKNISFPRTLVSIGAYAFYGSSLGNVTIIENIEKIGDMAFADCKNLINFTVDANNRSFSGIGGVLYTKDKTVLLCYPSGRTDDSFTVRSGVKEIASAAFYSCPALKTINFNGTENEWKKIIIRPNNHGLTALHVGYPKSNK